MKIVIIDYGAGNIQSVKFAFERLGVTPVLSHDIHEITSADKIIFPGVGAAGLAMEQLNQHQLAPVIKSLTQPVLGICLGMQLLCKSSEENNTECIGVFDVPVLKFENINEKVPQIGWNNIFDLKTKLYNSVSENDYVYFVHSYYVPSNEFTIASNHYGIDYSAAIQKDNFYATQFHPEKSGNVGAQILENFLNL